MTAKMQRSGTRLDWGRETPVDVCSRAEGLLDAVGLLEHAQDLEISRLVGGANNVSFIVRRGEQRWVMKLRSTHGLKLATGVTDAVSAQAAAAGLGVAPRILATTPAGDFLSDFIVGTTLRPELIRTQECLPGIVTALRSVHTIAPISRRFDILSDIRVFSDETVELGGTLPGNFAELRRVAERFDSVLNHAGAPVGFLHGDLVPQNMILCADGVKFVDFDYCGTGLFAADLAIVAAQAELDADQTERLLKLYDPNLEDSQRARILGIQLINTLREISWACAATCKVAETTALFEDWSYEYHARINETLAQRILRDHSVDDLAEAMAHVRPNALF